MKLFLCDSMEEYHVLNKRFGKQVGENEFIIGTVQSRFLLQCQKEHSELTCLLMEYSGGDKRSFVTQQLKKINYIMGEDLAKKYLFEVDYSIEGSGIAQEVANIVYKVEVCKNYQEQYEVEEIFIFCNKYNCLETEIFREIAGQKNLGLKIIYRKSWNLDSIKDRIFITSSKKVKNLKYLFYYAKLVQKYGCLFGCYFKNKKYRDVPVKNYDVGRVCFTDAIKHYNWGIDKIKEYRKKLSLNIICSGTMPETYERFTKDGFNASQFEESYLDLKYIFKELKLYFYWLKILLKRTKKLQVTYLNLDISNMIYHRIKQHLLVMVPEAVIIDSIAKGYFEKNKYKMIEGCMGGNNIYTRLFYYNTRAEETIFFRELNYDAYPLECIYMDEVESNVIGIRFFCGWHRNEIYQFYQANGWNGEAILLESAVGRVKAERKRKPEKNTIILWAPSYPDGSSCSYNTWFSLNIEIIESLKKMMNVTLLIKYHINQDDDSIEFLKKKYESDKVVFINKKDAIEPYIREADIVMTNPSTVIYDAMLMNRITIAIMSGAQVSLKNELNFITCIDTEKTINYVNKLIACEEAWVSRLDKQSEYVSKFLDIKTNDVNAMITETLCRKISEEIL